MTTLNEILKAIPLLSFDDVRKVNQFAHKILKTESSYQTREAKKNLYVGQAVSFCDKRGYRITGVIKKVNRTKCVVDTGEYRKWTVPMTMLTAA